MKDNFTLLLITLTALSATATTSFAANNDKDEYSYNYPVQDASTRCAPYDPYEGFNRKVFFVNGVIDQFTLRPIAKLYDKVTNNYTKQRVGSFIDNVHTPYYVLNQGLRGNTNKSFTAFWRVVINSTVGIGGLFDVADKLGLKQEKASLGGTLAYYGVGPGPYIVLPLLGGTSTRGLLDSTPSTYTNPGIFILPQDFFQASMYGELVHRRAELLPFTDYVTANSADPYIAVRNAILSKQEQSVHYPVKFKCPTMHNYNYAPK